MPTHQKVVAVTKSKRAPKAEKLPNLPEFLNRKFNKTGQTRGADDDDIFQNRVSRRGTVLIPFSVWKKVVVFPTEGKFESGYIVLISPEEYFQHDDIAGELAKYSLKLGDNALIYYQKRDDWVRYNPEPNGHLVAQKRIAPLGGHYVARIPATTAIENGGKIIEGFFNTKNKGAGIRIFEYASIKTISSSKLQL